MLNINDIIELSIESLASSGKGVGYYVDDTKRSVFVENSVPGDFLKIKIVSKTKAYFEAEIIQILKPSKQRVNPICQYFGVCGGCDWLHLNYNCQIKEKEKLLTYYFEKNSIAIPKIQLVPAINPLYYRDKIRLTNGFYKKESNEVVLVKECYIIRKEFWPLLSKTRASEECFGYDYKENKISKDKSYYYITTNSKKLCLSYHPSGFVQNNLVMNQVLVEEVLNLVDENKKILELYSGNGNFSIPLSLKSNKIVSVEGSSKSYNLLLENIKLNLITPNIDPYCEDVNKFLMKRNNYDYILLDPPRTGSNNILSKLFKMTNKIIYVSCNPIILAKELKDLSKEYKFEIKSIKLIDMFPQTKHFETVVLLEKQN